MKGRLACGRIGAGEGAKERGDGFATLGNLPFADFLQLEDGGGGGLSLCAGFLRASGCRRIGGCCGGLKLLKSECCCVP
jgi:hypothetical protein